LPFNDPLRDLFDLSGRRALITGSSRGLGFEFARALGGAGANIVLNGRSRPALEAAAERLRGEGIVAGISLFDVGSTAEVNEAVERLERDTGPINILVNNAGIQRRAPLESFTDADWRELMNINLDGVFVVSRAVARRMIERRAGAIINVASVQSELARPSIAPYTAAKGAIRMFTKAMAGEWGKYGIRVNAIAPGYFRTELNQALTDDPVFSGWLEKRTPLGRWGEPAELAGAAVLLASDAASFMTGQTIFVDGGITSVL
jgi:gluconate 5-dehydrogenase